MIQDYVPILLHVLVAIGFATVAMAANLALGRVGKRNPTKDAAYECGVRTEAGPQPRFSVKFYLVAMLFILFDIEIVFMYPWALAFADLVGGIGQAAAANAPIVLGSMAIFVLVLLFGYVYALKKGALDWSR